MQIPKIFHYHSQYYVHYKSYREREPSALDWNSRARTNTTSQNSQILKTQKLRLRPKPITQHLKITFMREREREREREPSQFAFHKYEAASR